TLVVEGDLAALPAPVSREGYRIVQESLTNALRHAGPVPVDVALTVHSGALVIDVANPASVDGSVPGRGLTRMRARVTLLGGDLSAGPDRGRWRVRVRLPVQEKA